ncbi:MAG: hypothetical protein PHR96_05480 [Clostridia bacterium]|nr:hypothetical protein [Clostridia bacterium]
MQQFNGQGDSLTGKNDQSNGQCKWSNGQGNRSNGQFNGLMGNAKTPAGGIFKSRPLAYFSTTTYYSNFLL